MKQYTPDEIQALLIAKGGTDEEKAAAIAVVEAAIVESRKLGRIALRKPKSDWQRSEKLLRKPLGSGWGSWLGK